ncbi:YqaA family protein [Desulforamulus ferrireducens]|uniref:VTT domain-containing protein n=1 Tax=Desulforamulus ferrireducens TaxID=1833852 RepID=A0A1S6IVW8_9FIRM|nr:YqaA family protein [Desulforamulus ferrireducens]AQS58918.1 hypothetical protein B0537_07365 [Desulforamulus ferrireducens]
MGDGLVQNGYEFFNQYGEIGLFIWSFIESSFFPVPPDVLLIAMSLSNPAMSLWYAGITTIASLLGGILGYVIGAKAGRPLLQRLVSHQRIEKINQLFHRYGGWAVGIAGFTPIPYKIFTISAGVFGINLKVFIIASALSRGARFFLEGLIIFYLGETAKSFLENYFEVITILVSIIIVLLFLLLRKKGTKK